MGFWTPSPNKKINELTTKIEASNFEILQLETKLREANEKMRHVNGHLESIGEVLTNLRSDEAKIVSLSEYVNLSSESRKIYDYGVQWSNVIAQLHKDIAVKKKEVGEYTEQRTKVEAAHGKVLGFRKRG